MKGIRRYDSGELLKIKKSLRASDKKLLDDFLKLCAVTAGASKLKNIERVLVKCADIIEVPLDKLNKSILIAFLSLVNKSDLEAATKNEIKKHLKRFVLNTPKYKHDEGVREALDLFKLENDTNHEKVNPDTIVKPNEINLLMRKTDSIKYKTLIITSWETAARPEELLKAKWEQVNLDKKTIRLFSNKTAKAEKGGWRTLPINESVAHLARLKEEWDFDNRTDKDFIFVGNKRAQGLSNDAWNVALKALSLKALGRAVYPYLIRHGRLTEIQDSMPSKAYEDFAGHSLEMATRYRHPSQARLLETMKKHLYSMKQLTKEQREELESKIAAQTKIIKELREQYKAMDLSFNSRIKQTEANFARDIENAMKKLK